MKLIKVKDGLLEAENFFLASSFSDFAGSSNVSRDIATGKLKLISNSNIERTFDYNEFVIEVEKDNFNNLGSNDSCTIYLGNEDYTFGIKDDIETGQNKYWKILKQDNYIQAYCSEDDINYINIGGMSFPDPITKQGFSKHYSEDFILNSYKVYSNPYVTIQNFPEGTICELYSLDNTLLKTRVFNSNMECKVFLDSFTEGYFIFKDPLGQIIYKTDNLNLGYGDVYILSPYNFEVIYHGNIVNDINPAFLQDLNELITIKNIDDKDYIGLLIDTKTSSNDLIQLSTDGINYTKALVIDLVALEIKDIYIKITKNVDNHNFMVRDFQLVIQE